MAEKKQINPVWWWILGAVFLCLLAYVLLPCMPWGIALERKDAVTSIIALGGVVGVVVNFFQTRKRITQQENQFRVQAELQQKQQRDARYASGVELLGNPHESTRIGGAYNLYFLARDYPEFRAPVCEILCAHLRTIAHKEKFVTDEELKKYPKNEIHSIFDLLFKQRNGDLIFEGEGKNLREVLLTEYSFRGTSLTDVQFLGATLTDVDFVRATLTDVYFQEGTLTDVYFWGAALTDVYFRGGTLTNVDFRGATLTGVDFLDTPLADFTPEQITFLGFSLEKTAPNP